MLKNFVRTFMLLGTAAAGISTGDVWSSDEQLAEAPSLDTELTDNIKIDPNENYEERQESILSNVPRDRNSEDGSATPQSGTSAASPESTDGSSYEDIESIASGEQVSASGSHSDTDINVVNSSTINVVNNTAATDDTVPAETAGTGTPAEENGTSAAEVKNSGDSAAGDSAEASGKKADSDEVAAIQDSRNQKKENTASDNSAGEKNTETVASSVDSSTAESTAKDTTGTDVSGQNTEVKKKGSDNQSGSDSMSAGAETPKVQAGDTGSQKKDSTGSDTHGKREPVYEALKLRQHNENHNPNLYSREYLREMYLPFFKNTYELPQELDPYITLRDVRLDKKGPVLVYDIGVADAMGPMDFDGTPDDNRTLNLFCRIGLNEGILHRIDKMVLVFYHDDRDFSEVSLDYLKCTGKEPILVEKNVLSRESIRLDDEFTFAYESEKEKNLSSEYLTKRFAPYALKRIGETFDKAEGSPRMTADEKGNLIVEMTVPAGEENKVKTANYVAGRIERTCDIETYRKWVLPRINSMKYVYVDAKNGQELKEVVVTDKACQAVRSRRKR